jgi:O-antigen/teichoic acid export membrane protein
MQAELAIRTRPGRAYPVPLTRPGQFVRRLLPGCALAASRGSAILAQFACQLVVGTLAGANGLGILQLFSSWTCMAGEALALGLPPRAMRQVAVAYAGQQRTAIEQLLQQSRRKILRAWLWFIALAAPLFPLLTRGASPGDWTSYHWLLIATGLTAPLFALLRLYAESLKSAGAALMAITLENLTSPLTMLLICAACWLAAQPLLALTLAIAFGCSMAITAIALRAALGHQLTALPLNHSAGDTCLAPPAQGDQFYLWASSVLSIAFMHLPFLVMPLYVDTAEIGVFALAHKLINVITTGLLLLAAVYGPAFARCAASRDTAGLRLLLRRTQLISSAAFIPAALLLVAVAAPLAELFGKEFAGLQTFLVILAGGYLVSAATGLCGVMLNMAGAASRELACLLLALVLALVGGLWVGPQYGSTGLALLFSCSIALKNIASYIMARHLLDSIGEPA